ncbi:MAG: hypothetical protein ABSB37_13445 [Xanthobacteraceae bacterium]|jgi:hypothetical protein
MNLFGRMRSLIDPTSVEQLPTEVFAALIDDLYAPLGSFMIGAAAAFSSAEWRPSARAAPGYWH